MLPQLVAQRRRPRSAATTRYRLPSDRTAFLLNALMTTATDNEHERDGKEGCFHDRRLDEARDSPRSTQYTPLYTPFARSDFKNR